MKADLLDLQGKKMRSLDLPFQFSEEVRPDLIQRAVLAIHSHNRQPYGTKPDAGMRHSSKLSRRRRQFRGSYTHGIARSPRKIMTRRGTQFFWVGATAPNTRGGRRSHPPKAGKIWAQHINVQERRKAIRSALAATLLLDVVRMRGHKVSSVPLVVESKLEALSSTKELKTTLERLNLKEELLRTKERKIRAGKGKARGRKYKTKTGPLIIVSEPCTLMTLTNIPGVDIVPVRNLNAELLAPGCMPGRLCLWTDKALEKLGKEKLFA